MKNITFRNIRRLGQKVFENDFYIHVHNPEMLLQYDSNFIRFKRMPAMDEFKQAEEYLRFYHKKFGQNHLRFYFPEGEKLTTKLSNYMNHEANYTIGFLELFAIQPTDFVAVADHPDIVVEKVAHDTLESFLQFQYEQDAVYGHNYAEQKQGQHLRNFKDENILQIIALYKGGLAGSADVIIAEDTAEIDGLVVKEDFQRKGIGSRIQKFVMDEFLDKTVVLVADGEDTPKEMYRKQNYQYLGFQYESLKLDE
ncbi:GNAT family N-acetyltransferase [Peribacillus sp. SCS-155]|uniref:GNAT family N-acetyltransferase n=1 Tax=Peribacillus sedimenti TaxID=3115297 RepID=UPI003905A2C3